MNSSFRKINDMSEKINQVVSVAEVGGALYALIVEYEEGDGGNGVGLVYKTDGTRDSAVEPALSTNDYLRAMWASPSGSLWLSSEGGNIWTTADVKWKKPDDPNLGFDVYDPAFTWSVTQLPDVQGKSHAPNLGAIWGTDDSNVFAAVFDGPIYHWDGNAWRQVHRASGTIRSFSGSSASDVFAVGEKGALEHFDGSVWRTLRNPDGGRVDESFTGACHAVDGSVYICSRSGRLLHGSASGLTVLAQNEDIRLAGLAFLGDRLLLVAGEKGVAELQKSAIVVIRSTFNSTYVASGGSRLFFLDASTDTGYINYDPADTDEPWCFVRF
jgi:hypothetical protein